MTADDDFDPGYPMEQVGMENVPADLGEAINAEILKASSEGATKAELLGAMLAAVSRGAVALPVGGEVLRAYLRQKIGAVIASGRKSKAYSVDGRTFPVYVHYRDDEDAVRTVHAKFVTLHVWMRSLDIKRNNVAAVQQAFEDDMAIARYVEMKTSGDMFAFIVDHKDDDEAEELAA